VDKGEGVNVETPDYNVKMYRKGNIVIIWWVGL